jgi:hypothetical protein
MDAFERCTATKDHHHLVGNHELYNFQRRHMRDTPPHKRLAANYSYHSFCAHPKWRVIVLDAFEIGVVGWPEGHPNQISAWKLLDHHNHNDCRRKGVNWVSGMQGLQRRFLPYNGGVGPAQLEWLCEELDAACEQGQRVIVMSHMPIHPGKQSSQCSMRLLCVALRCVSLHWLVHIFISSLMELTPGCRHVFPSYRCNKRGLSSVELR